LPLQLTIDVGGGTAGLSISGAPQRAEAAPAAPPPGANGSGEHAPAQDEMVSAWRAYESAGRAAEGSEAPPPELAPAAAPTSVESAMEWLTGQTGGPSTMQEQFAQDRAA
jgi:hypothetical protein